MAKIKNNNTNEIEYADSRDAYFSTKKEMVIKITDLPMSTFYPKDTIGKAVIAEDKNGYYLTNTTYIDVPLLDPYRQYKRNLKILKTETGFEIKKDNISYSINN